MSSASEATRPAEASVVSETTPPPYDRWTLRDDSEIDYGYLSRTRGAGIDEVAVLGEDDGGTSPSSSKHKFYITTAINYTNGPAHMGHAYEATTTDVLARYHRLKGDAAFFLTGTDEHGQKIANTARDMGKEPIEVCDLFATGFQVLNQRILISNDDYLRTTSERHKRTAKELWKLCAAQDDVYLDTYEGWYNVKEETYVTDSEAELLNYLCPNSGQPLKRVEEASYFFRMSKYKDRLLEHILSHPEFIQPESHRNQILTRLRTDELRDLSISRTNFSWGIPVPEGFDSSHVLYVWMDGTCRTIVSAALFLAIVSVSSPWLPRSSLSGEPCHHVLSAM
jgi:methionyl-tRNA synthetase